MRSLTQTLPLSSLQLSHSIPEDFWRVCSLRHQSLVRYATGHSVSPSKKAANGSFFVHQVSTMRRLETKVGNSLSLAHLSSHSSLSSLKLSQSFSPRNYGVSVHCAPAVSSQTRHRAVSRLAVINDRRHCRRRQSRTISPSKTAAKGSFFVHQMSTMRRLNSWKLFLLRTSLLSPLSSLKLSHSFSPGNYGVSVHCASSL